MAIKFLSTVQVDTDVLYVDTSNDRVGIGTPTPTTGKLVVSSSANQLALDTGTAGDGRLNIGHFSNGTFIGTYGDDGGGADLIRFGTHSGDERMRITSGGDVGIGTTSPSAKLDVIGVGRILMPNDPLTGAVTAKILSYSTAPYGMVFRSYSSGTNSIQVQRENNNSQTFALSLQPNNGNVGIGTTNPVTKLQISGTNSSTSATALFSIQKNEEGYGLFSGILSSGTSWLQSSTKTESTHYSLALQPNGGNVGIGTTSPVAKLDVLGTSGGPVVFDYQYATNAGLRIHGDESAMDIVGTDSGNHASTILLRNGNEGFGLLNNPNLNTLQFRSFTATADAFSIHNTGSSLSSLVDIVTLKKGGNVGIGTTSPNYELTIGGGSINSMQILSSSTGSGATDGLRFWNTGGSVAMWNYDNTPTLFGTNNAERMRIDSGGNVLIGNTTAGAKLDVRADTGYAFRTENASGYTFRIEASSGNIYTAGDLYVEDNNKIRLGASGDLQIYHDGADSYLDNDTGHLYIRNKGNDKDVYFQNDDGAGGLANYFYLDGGGAITRVSKNFRTDDSIKLQAGSSGDLNIFHNGTNSYIENDTGDLYIRSNFQDRDIIFQSDNGGGGIATYIQIDGSTGAVQLNHYGSKKFETKSYGVEITGQLVSTDNIQVGNNLILGDNKKAFFGGSNDLQIYHNGSNSYINDTGTGDLYIQASDNMYFQTYGSGKRWITLTENAGVDLFHNDAHKLSTGAVSVGIATTTGGTLIDGWKTTTQANAINDTTIATTAYVNNKIALIPAGLVFQGTWNAATNTPTLTSGSGTTGNFYIVSVAGSTNLDGITDWKVGDWAVFIEQGASDQWEKIDNSSVLDGFGTGQSVTKWDGSGTSNTLTDGPITFSGNNSTFAGAVGVGVSGGSNAKLEVVATSGEVFRADSNNGAYRLVVDQTGANIQGTLDVLGQVDIKTGNDLRLYRSDNATYARFNYAGGSVGLDIDDLNGDGINLQQAGVNKLRIETSGNATFAGTINSDNITVGKGDGNNSFISLTANTGNWTFTNVQASRNLEISDSDGTGVALTIDTNANATFAGNIALGDGKVVKWGNGNQQILGNNTSGLALYSNGERMRILTNGNVGIGTTSPTYKLSVSGGIEAGGVVTYSKVASSLDTTGFAIAGLGTAFNGSSAGFTFTAYGGTGKYQKVVYSCYGSGTTWYVKKVIDEGTNTFDIVASASSAATITFTFKTRSGSQGYSPRVVIEATGHSIISTYA